VLGIDWLGQIEGNVDNGHKVLACPALAEKEWVIGKPIDELRTLAKRLADAKKITVSIVALLPRTETLGSELFLVPTKIIDSPDKRGSSQVKWSLVDTKEAAEMMRDVKYGPAPYFGIQVVESVPPTVAAKASLSKE